MSELLQARADIAKKLNVMVRKIEEVTVFLLTGEKECPPADIHFVVATADAASLPDTYADLHILVTEFLRPASSDKTEEDGRIIANYTFGEGLNAEIFFCAEDHLPAFDWWVCYLDRNGAAEIFYTAAARCPVDPTGKEEEEFIEEAAPSAVEDELEGARLRDEQRIPQDANRALWDKIYERVNLAKHAVAGGSYFYAAEIIGDLRTAIMRLICQKHGITRDYLHSIDLLANNMSEALAQTYPSKLDSSHLIAALAAELSLFEKLLN